MVRALLIGLLVFSLAAHTASAQQQKRVYYSSGTGFFISPYGDLITNAHVIQDCLPGRITLEGAVNGRASVVAIDQPHDLALLRSQQYPSDTAQLAATERSIQPGDTVMVMGYPHNRPHDYQYSVAMAQLIDVRGPQGEPHWLQFSDSAQQGNSGGPLLDDAGHVIGVVTGKTELYRINQRTRQKTALGSSDIAVALPVLKSFLLQNHVRFQQGDSRIRRSDAYVESRARRYIAQIRCVTGEELVRR